MRTSPRRNPAPRARRSRPLALALGLATVLAVAACSQSASSGPGSQSSGSDGQETVSVTVATADASASALPIYAAVDGGFAAADHVNVTKVDALSPQACNAAVVSGSVDFCADGGGNFSAEINDPGKIKVIATYSRTAQELYAVKSITSLAQLKGKTVAATTAGGPFDVGARALLKSGGLTPGGDVQISYLQSPTAIFSALQAGRISAGVLSPPVDFQAQAAGLTDLGSTSPFIQPNSLAVNAAFASAHPQAVVDFLKAVIAGAKEATTNESAAEASVQKYTGVTDKVTLQKSFEAYKSLLKVTAYPIDQVKATLAGLSATLPKAAGADPSTLVDSSFYNQATAS